MAVVAVIGGRGRMGAWFAKFLSTNGYEIIVCDKNVSAARRMAKKNGFKFMQSPVQAAQLSDIVLFATSTHATGFLLREVASHLVHPTLLVEISSIKEPVRKTIRELARHGTQIMSIHPMFGPGTRNLAGKSVIVAAEPRDCAPARRLVSIIRKRGAKIIESNLEKHDQLVATTLALPHLMNFAFIETIKRIGLPLDEAREIGGTTFKLQLIIAESLYHESLSNEASILADNKHNPRTFTIFAQQVEQFQEILRRKSRGELLRRLQSDAAYVRRNRLFGLAHERLVAAVDASTSRRRA